MLEKNRYMKKVLQNHTWRKKVWKIKQGNCIDNALLKLFNNVLLNVLNVFFRYETWDCVSLLQSYTFEFL